jgi:hypothetical protein
MCVLRFFIYLVIGGVGFHVVWFMVVVGQVLGELGGCWVYFVSNMGFVGVSDGAFLNFGAFGYNFVDLSHITQVFVGK